MIRSHTPPPAISAPHQHRRLSPFVGSVVAALTLTPMAAAAQDALVAVDAQTRVLPPLVLSAGLTPVPQDEYGRAATVLDGDALRRKGLRTVAEALREVPGVAINATDLSDAVVRIRGHKGDQTLILVDGVEQIADLGGTRLGGLDLSDIARIEVLRGPQSGSYGTGAAAGVVSIITRRATEGLHYGGAVEGGGGTTASFHVSQRGARAGISLAADWRDDAGWDLSGEDGEKDGLTRRGIRLSGDVQATDDITLGFSLRRAREEYDFDTTSFSPTSEADYILDDSYPNGRSDRSQAQVWGEWRMLDGRLTHRLGYDWARDERVSDTSPFFDPATAEVERQALRYRLSYALDGETVDTSRQVISMMVERVEDDSPIEDRYRRASNALALEYRGEIRPDLSLQVGVRRDNNDSYADATSWNAALAYVLPDSGIKLHTSAGDGRRRPVFYELFGDGIYTLPNLDLTPERNRSIDLGVTVPFANGAATADLTVFSERVTDRIVYVVQPDFTGVYDNADGTSRRKGVEASLQWAASDQLSLRGHGTWTDSRDPDDARELRVPKVEIGLGATWTTADGRGTFGADLRHVSGVRDIDRVTRNAVTLDSYTVVDVSGRWALNDAVALTGRIENLTDTDHSDAWGYASRGRTAYVGLAANF